MRFWILCALGTIVLGATGAIYNGPNRITAHEDRGARCLNKAMDYSTCEQRRISSLNKGCISQEEYDSLKGFGAYPICSDEGEGLELRSWCPCGCFHPDTAISIDTSDASGTSLATALDITNEIENYRVIHLAPNASMSNFALESSPIKIATSGPEARSLIVIITQDNRTLKLTDQHPILTAKGEMVLASELKIDDGLLDQGGFRVEIASLSTEKFVGEVVNFMIDKPIDSRLEHVIFANRIAVGDLAWQSSLEDEHRQVIIRM